MAVRGGDAQEYAASFPATIPAIAAFGELVIAAVLFGSRRGSALRGLLWT